MKTENRLLTPAAQSLVRTTCGAATVRERLRRSILAAVLLMCACSRGPAVKDEVRQFLTIYNDVDRRLYTVSADANWKASTDVRDLHSGQRIAADSALAAFRGSASVIDNVKRFRQSKESLDDLEVRQLDKILLAAAESPGTIPDVVTARIETEARAADILNGFAFCLDRRGDKCVKPTNPNDIDEKLEKSRDLKERRAVWEASKETGPALKETLVKLRDLRNRVASELGYSSYFHLQVADYGMTVAEMMQLMDRAVADMRPLYEQLHLWTRRQLAKRYKQAVPKKIPAHWIGNRWAQEWPGLVEAVDIDAPFRAKSREWIVEQGERFYTSIGMPPLPKGFWDKSDLYQLPPDAKRKKNTHASAWHIDRDSDVRSLMSVIPNYRWFETSHHELGHVYYFMAYSNPRVPSVLREGANRAFHEAIGDLISIAARQQPYLKELKLLAEGQEIDQTKWLLNEALDNAVVFLPFSAGTMSRFEHDLYEKKLPADQLNRRWWELAGQYQGVEPPAERGEQYCDGCTKTHVIDDAAQYYDYALAYLLKYQLHDHIARKILKQDPHNCNYYGNKEVGKWLWDLLSLGATRDWRQVVREKTGEDLSSRAMLEYFRPLLDYLAKENGSEPAAW